MSRSREELWAGDADRPVLVPFGGAEHDWAALEVGAWFASAKGVALRLLGASAETEAGSQDASRLLAHAALAVQQLVGVATEPALAEPGADGVIRAAEDAQLLVVGLSDSWRQEGLGAVRSAIATRRSEERRVGKECRL